MGGGGKLQVHYGDLNNASAMLAQEAQHVTEMMTKINQRTEELRGGEFVGQASNSFYNEVEHVLLPGMKKLIQSLEDTSNLMKQLNSLFANAEQQAGNLFKKTN